MKEEHRNVLRENIIRKQPKHLAVKLDPGLHHVKTYTGAVIPNVESQSNMLRVNMLRVRNSDRSVNLIGGQNIETEISRAKISRDINIEGIFYRATKHRALQKAIRTFVFK